MIEKAAGETQRSTLATISITSEFLNASFPITIGLGAYPREDQESRHTMEFKCTRDWTPRIHIYGYMEVWANGKTILAYHDWGKAEAKLDGQVTGTVILSELDPDQCP